MKIVPTRARALLVSVVALAYDVPGPGKYTYACVLHLPSGMVGEIDAR